MSPIVLVAALALLAGDPGPPAVATPAVATPAADAPAAAASPDRVVRDGVVVDFSLRKTNGRPGGLVEGDFAEIRFRMTDAASGRPVPGLKPAAWLDMAGTLGGRGGEATECKDKVALYLQGSVGIRPMVDLNSYYLLVMNQDASISVIDPVVSMTGNTSLFTTLVFKRPPADWAKSADEKWLYVSTPRAGEVAVVDAEAFKIRETVKAGANPLRVVLQGDGRYLWVGNDAEDARESGVTVLDTATRKAVAFVRTGRGHHEIAFSPGDRHAFVTNRIEGTVSVIDVGSLRKVKDLVTGPLPIAVAASPLSGALYVADGRAGTIAVVDPERLEVTQRLPAAPGLGPIRFSPDGRWGFAVNPSAKKVFVVDAAENRVVHALSLPGQPYQAATTRGFAYFRQLDSPQVQMVNLLSLGTGKQPILQTFGAGEGAPRLAGDLAIADAITPAASDAAVFVVNPSDNTTSFYMEGMNQPMGSFGGYGHAVRAALIVDRSLKELEPGVYGGRLRIPAAGRYDVAFLLDSPRLLHCFHADAAPDPALAGAGGELNVEFLALPTTLPPGRTSVRVKLVNPANGRPRTGLEDVTVLYYRLPSGQRTRARAVERGDGVYEAPLELSQPGTWYALLAVPSLKLAPNQLPYRGIIVRPDAAGRP